MMKINIRVISFVVALATTIAAGVVLVRQPKQTVSFSERIDPQVSSSSDRLEYGLQLSLNELGVVFSVPDCEKKWSRDKFFMHVYPGGIEDGVTRDYINRDFDLAVEPTHSVVAGTKRQCVLVRAYGTPKPKEVVIGQFSMPGGRCCDIVWSRIFVVGN